MLDCFSIARNDGSVKLLNPMQLLKIRYYQLKRDLGLLFFVIATLLSALSYFVFQHPKKVGIEALVIIVYLFYAFHQKRRDKAFVYKHFSLPALQIVQEYQLFLLFISLPILFTDYWYCFFILHAGVLLFSLINVTVKSNHKFSFITKYLANDYIFISGFRKKAIPLLLLLLLAIVLSPVKLFGLVALMAVNVLIFSFFDSNESVQMIQSYNCNAKQFLRIKISEALRYFLIINIPLVMINTLFNLEMLWMNLYYFGYTAFLLMSVIILKYSNYSYKKQTSNNEVKMIVMFLGLFYPYLIILSAFYFFQSRSEAIKNLSQYLDDNH